MKILYICDKCQEVHRDSAQSIILIRYNGTIALIGGKATTLEEWDKLGSKMGEMVRHDLEHL